MAILEAACCNLLVVTTNVGGVPEVLPDRMVYLSAPSSEDLKEHLCHAIEDVPNIDTSNFYDELKEIYSWEEVARKTVKVYNSVVNMEYPTILSRIKHTFALGAVVWFLTYAYIHLEYIILYIIDLIWPADEIDILPDFDHIRYKDEGILNFGNHSFNVKEKNYPELDLIGLPSQDQSQTGSSDHLKALRLLIGTKEKLIRSEVGSRTIRYETIRPDTNT